MDANDQGGTDVITHLLNRLRCRYPIGPMVNGEPEFGWRDMGGPMNVTLPLPISLEAANVIEAMAETLAIEQAKLAIAYAALIDVRGRAEYLKSWCSTEETTDQSTVIHAVVSRAIAALESQGD